MRIFLVRHGQSKSNIDWTENLRTPDHAIELTEEGHEQAKEAGKFLGEYFNNLFPPMKRVHDMPKIRLWHSPMMRARQTAQEVHKNCIKYPGKKFEGGWFIDKKEHLLLAEQQFGLFDGLSDEERAEKFPAEQSHYEKCKNFEGKMWPKMPMGESRFEVCQRVHQSFGTFHRDKERHGIKNIVVVGHGTTNRAFIQMWLHKPWEWMHKEPNPKNCSIRLIDDDENGNSKDMGYIFEGFE